MIKLMAHFNPRPGTDPEELWHYWYEVHGPPHIGPGLLKYSVNRVIPVEKDSPINKVVDGTPKFWGVAELYFESAEAVQRGGEAPKLRKYVEEAKKSPGGDWFERITDHTMFALEEKVIYEAEDFKKYL
jgi:uncharacterized protein (TIGR02118 family)